VTSEGFGLQKTMGEEPRTVKSYSTYLQKEKKKRGGAEAQGLGCSKGSGGDEFVTRALGDITGGQGKGNEVGTGTGKSETRA